MKMNIIIVPAALLFLSLVFSTNCNSNKMKGYPYVVGMISEIELVEIQNKAKGKTSRYETRVTLVLSEAFDSLGNTMATETYSYPSFAGTPEIADRYEVGQKVKIVCTTSSGRHIEKIEKVG